MEFLLIPNDYPQGNGILSVSLSTRTLPYIKLKLIKNAAIWYQGVQDEREHVGEGKIESWEKMKKYLRQQLCEMKLIEEE